MSRTPSTRVLYLPRVRFTTLSKIIPTPSSINTSTTPDPLPNKSNSQRKLKNCTECTRAHRCCVFPSPGNLECTHCLKMHLFCTFHYSGLTISLLVIFPYHSYSYHFVCYISHFRTRSPQRFDFEKTTSFPVFQGSTRTTASKRLVNHQSPGSTLNIISESVHCNPLTQYTVSSGLSCHTHANL